MITVVTNEQVSHSHVVVDGALIHLVAQTGVVEVVGLHVGEDSQSDIERHVDMWIADYQATWDGRVEDAMNAA